MPRILYFAQLADALGMTSEDITLPSASVSVTELLQLLAGSDGARQRVFADASKFRVAVNKAFASPETRVNAGDEVAIVPTGPLN